MPPNPNAYAWKMSGKGFQRKVQIAYGHRGQAVFGNVYIYEQASSAPYQVRLSIQKAPLSVFTNLEASKSQPIDAVGSGVVSANVTITDNCNNTYTGFISSLSYNNDGEVYGTQLYSGEITLEDTP